MPRYAQISNGVCVAESNPPTTVDDARLVPVPDGSPPVLGFSYSGGTFFAPAPAPPAPDPRILWLTIGAFKDRFGPDGPAIYASTHSACKGGVGILEGRQQVDLANPLIAQMLDVLIAANQPTADPVWPGSSPMTAAKKAAILNPVTVEAERFVKGLG